MLCRVAAVKSLSVRHHSAGYILFPLGSLNPSWLFRIPLKPALVEGAWRGCVAYEETQSNRVSNFRDFV